MRLNSGPTTYSASPNDTGDVQVLTVVAMPQQTLRDVVLQHGGRFDEETVKEIRALNPQLNPDQIEAGQLIRIPLPAGTWQKKFDTADSSARTPVQSLRPRNPKLPRDGSSRQTPKHPRTYTDMPKAPRVNTSMGLFPSL